MSGVPDLWPDVSVRAGAAAIGIGGAAGGDPLISRRRPDRIALGVASHQERRRARELELLEAAAAAPDEPIPVAVFHGTMLVVRCPCCHGAHAFPELLSGESVLRRCPVQRSRVFQLPVEAIPDDDVPRLQGGARAYFGRSAAEIAGVLQLNKQYIGTLAKSAEGRARIQRAASALDRRERRRVEGVETGGEE